MGVDIATYRCRIGTFNPSTSSLFDNESLKVLGAVGFIGMLLFMAGVEINPGPISDLQTLFNCGKLDEIRCRKNALMEEIPMTERFADTDKLVIDELSHSLLPSVLPPEFSFNLPYRSKGNGNCLFNSVSMILIGDEQLSSHLRSLTAIEIYLNPEKYAKHPKIEEAVQNGFFSDDLSVVLTTLLCDEAAKMSGTPCDQLKKEALVLCQDYSWAGQISVMALSSVLNCDIFTIFPDVNTTYRNLYGLIQPIEAQERKESTICVMWTRDGTLDNTPNSTFVANHVVPLMPPRKQKQAEKSKPAKQSKQLTMSSFFMQKSARKRMASNDDDTCPDDVTLNEPVKKKESRQAKNNELVVPDQPYQPAKGEWTFPRKQYGKRTRSFLPHWFQLYKWLHYDKVNDRVFCYPCMLAYKAGQISQGNFEPAFILTGYSNWKNATERLPIHADCLSHKEAIARVMTIPGSVKDVGETLSSAHEEEKRTNRQVFMKILSNIQFLAKQGLSFRGRNNDANSNFIQLFHLRSEDNPFMSEWFKKKSDKYTSPEIQNQILQVMSNQVLRKLVGMIRQAEFYTIMIDETTDEASREQVVFCLRWVDENLECHEDFLGLYYTELTDAKTLAGIIKDILLRFHLSLDKCRGQCYDGCSTMAGLRNGVAKIIKETEARALFTHCYGHALNLACAECVRKIKILKDTLDTTLEITKLVHKSPKRNSKLDNIKKAYIVESENAEVAPNVRLLCPTRWTVRAEALHSIIGNYDHLLDLWEWALANCSDTEMKARIRGVESHMQTFDFFFGLYLGRDLLRHADQLSSSLQEKSLSASEGQTMAQSTVDTLKTLRTVEAFDTFWKVVSEDRIIKGVSEPKLPRKRSMPKRYDEGQAQPEFHNTVEKYYRQKYFEAFDLLIGFIQNRFDQKDYQIYSQCEQIFLKCVKGKDYITDLSSIIDFYKDDFNQFQLETQLMQFQVSFSRSSTKENPTIRDIINFFTSLTHNERLLMPQVVKLLKLVLVMPATNSTSERSFSALRRILTYLRTSMHQNRLNNLMVLNVHLNTIEGLNLSEVANDFVGLSEHRKSFFGTFTSADSIMSTPKISKGTQTVSICSGDSIDYEKGKTRLTESKMMQ